MPKTILLEQKSHNNHPPLFHLRPLPPPNKPTTRPPLRNNRRSKILPHERNSRHSRNLPPPSTPRVPESPTSIPPKKPQPQDYTLIHNQIPFPSNNKILIPPYPYPRLHIRIHIPLLVLPEILLPKNILRSNWPAATSTPTQHVGIQQQQSI